MKKWFYKNNGDNKKMLLIAQRTLKVSIIAVIVTISGILISFVFEPLNRPLFSPKETTETTPSTSENVPPIETPTETIDITLTSITEEETIVAEPAITYEPVNEIPPDGEIYTGEIIINHDPTFGIILVDENSPFVAEDGTVFPNQQSLDEYMIMLKTTDYAPFITDDREWYNVFVYCFWVDSWVNSDYDW